MRTLLCLLTGAIMIAVLSLGVRAEEPTRPDAARGPGLPPSPMLILQRLDKNKDGKVQLSEVPNEAPEFVKTKLKEADANQDGTVTAEELRRTFSPNHPAIGSPGVRRPAVQAQRVAKPAQPQLIHRPQPATPASPIRRPSVTPSKMPDAKAIFARLDKDKDGKLTPEEFAAGMKALHAAHPSIHRPVVQRPAQAPPQAKPQRPIQPSPQRKPAWRPTTPSLAGRPMWSPRSSFRPPWSTGAAAVWKHRPGGMARPSWARPPSRAGWQPGKPASPAWRPHSMHGPSSAFAQRLKALDKNHDGKISKAEAPDPMQPFFDRLDVNKDGQIAPGEAMKARADAARHKQVDAAKRRTEAAKHTKDKAADRAKGKKRAEKGTRSPNRKDASRTPSSKA